MIRQLHWREALSWYLSTIAGISLSLCPFFLPIAMLAVSH